MNRSLRTIIASVLVTLLTIAGFMQPASASPVSPAAISSDITRTFGSSVIDAQVSLSSLILIPETANVTPVMANGFTIWPNVQPGVSLSARYTLDAGNQQFIRIANKHATTNFLYNLRPGFIAKPGPANSVEIYATGHRVATIPKPSAADYYGRTVPTHYEVTRFGTTIRQVVEHNTGKFTYPVVADPYTRWWSWGYTKYFTRTDTQNAILGLSAGALLAAFAGAGVAFTVGAMGVLLQIELARGQCYAINRNNYGWMWLSLYPC